ncbi:MAG: response regulator [Pseudomonadota bacterium]
MDEPTSGPEKHILVADDDDRIRTLLKRYLSENGYGVSTASNGTEASTLLNGVEFDLLILDVMMPGLDGFDLTQRIRAASNVPILLLTARGLPQDRIEGLEKGADDYLTKPFEPRELLLRCAALLRRTEHTQKARDIVTFGNCTFIPGRGELKQGDEFVKLTSSEIALLKAFCAKPGEAISRAALAQQTDAELERSVDVQVTRLRKKIEADPRNPMLLQTVRGIGYVLLTD